MGAILLRPAGASAGPAVLSATLELPRVGAWVAEVSLATDSVPSGKVELVLGDVLTIKGTVSRAAVFEGRVSARVVAGADGLRKAVIPKHYTSPTVGVVLRDILGDVGEAQSASIASALLSTQLEHWTTIAMPAGQALRCLAPMAGADIAWRHLPDGTVWLGSEAWPDSRVTDYADVSASPGDATVEIHLLTPELLPGTLLGGRRVDALEIRVSGGSVDATAWLLPT